MFLENGVICTEEGVFEVIMVEDKITENCSLNNNYSSSKSCSSLISNDYMEEDKNINETSSKGSSSSNIKHLSLEAIKLNKSGFMSKLFKKRKNSFSIKMEESINVNSPFLALARKVKINTNPMDELYFPIKKSVQMEIYWLFYKSELDYEVNIKPDFICWKNHLEINNINNWVIVVILIGKYEKNILFKRQKVTIQVIEDDFHAMFKLYDKYNYYNENFERLVYICNPNLNMIDDNQECFEKLTQSVVYQCVDSFNQMIIQDTDNLDASWKHAKRLISVLEASKNNKNLKSNIKEFINEWNIIELFKEMTSLSSIYYNSELYQSSLENNVKNYYKYKKLLTSFIFIKNKIKLNDILFLINSDIYTETKIDEYKSWENIEDNIFKSSISENIEEKIKRDIKSLSLSENTKELNKISKHIRSNSYKEIKYDKNQYYQNKNDTIILDSLEILGLNLDNILLNNINEINTETLNLIHKIVHECYSKKCVINNLIPENQIKKSCIINLLLSFNSIGLQLFLRMKCLDYAIYYSLDAIFLSKCIIKFIYHDSKNKIILDRITSIFMLECCIKLLQKVTKTIDYLNIKSIKYIDSKLSNLSKTNKSLNYALSHLLSIIDKCVDKLHINIASYSYKSPLEFMKNENIKDEIKNDIINDDKIRNKCFSMINKKKEDNFQLTRLMTQVKINYPKIDSKKKKKNQNIFDISIVGLKSLLKPCYFEENTEMSLSGDLAFSFINQTHKILTNFEFYNHIQANERNLLFRFIKQENYIVALDVSSNLLNIFLNNKWILLFIDILLIQLVIFFNLISKKYNDLLLYTIYDEKFNAFDGKYFLINNLISKFSLILKIEQINNLYIASICLILLKLLFFGKNFFYFNHFNAFITLFHSLNGKLSHSLDNISNFDFKYTFPLNFFDISKVFLDNYNFTPTFFSCHVNFRICLDLKIYDFYICQLKCNKIYFLYQKLNDKLEFNDDDITVDQLFDIYKNNKLNDHKSSKNYLLLKNQNVNLINGTNIISVHEHEYFNNIVSDIGHYYLKEIYLQFENFSVNSLFSINYFDHFISSFIIKPSSITSITIQENNLYLIPQFQSIILNIYPILSDSIEKQTFITVSSPDHKILIQNSNNDNFKLDNLQNLEKDQINNCYLLKLFISPYFNQEKDSNLINNNFYVHELNDSTYCLNLNVLCHYENSSSIHSTNYTNSIDYTNSHFNSKLKNDSNNNGSISKPHIEPYFKSDISIIFKHVTTAVFTTYSSSCTLNQFFFIFSSKSRSFHSYHLC